LPRKPRIVIEDGVYHVISRGVNNEPIFKDENDYFEFLSLLKKESIENNIKVLCYCLMKNHYHLLLKIKTTNLSNFIQILNSKYAKFINQKYFRIGHLFQNRFKSHFINNLNYLINVSRYIHLNPVEINIVDRPEKYRWSSYKYYISNEKENNHNNSFIDIKEFFLLTSLSKETYKEYIEEYLKLIKEFDLHGEGLDIDISKILKTLKNNYKLNYLNNLLLRDILIYYFINKNIKMEKIGKFFNLSKYQVYRIYKKIFLELEKNSEYMKLYNSLLLKIPIYEE